MATGGLAPGIARQVPAGYPIYIVIPLLVPIFLVGLLFGGPLGEEPGWRGFALAPLLAGFHSLFASAILDTVWGLWHTPLFLIAGTSQSALPLGVFVLWTIGLSSLFTRPHERSGGSVTLAILFPRGDQSQCPATGPAHGGIPCGAAILVPRRARLAGLRHPRGDRPLPPDRKAAQCWHGRCAPDGQWDHRAT